jgi:hypothetical protein
MSCFERLLGAYARTVFVGQTQEGNAFATAAGPKLNAATGLKCAGNANGFCIFGKDGISIPTDNFLNYQRFYNIYDGPVYQESNAYLNIKGTKIENTTNGEYIYGLKSGDADGFNANRSLGIPRPRSGPLRRICRGRLHSHQRGDRLEAAQRILLSPGLSLQKPGLQECGSASLVLVPLFKEGNRPRIPSRCINSIVRMRMISSIPGPMWTGRRSSTTTTGA